MVLSIEYWVLSTSRQAANTARNVQLTELRFISHSSGRQPPRNRDTADSKQGVEIHSVTCRRMYHVLGRKYYEESEDKYNYLLTIYRHRYTIIFTTGIYFRGGSIECCWSTFGFRYTASIIILLMLLLSNDGQVVMSSYSWVRIPR